jgi:hypothetical protein
MENTGTLRIVRVRTFLIITKKPIFHKIKYSLIYSNPQGFEDKLFRDGKG